MNYQSNLTFRCQGEPLVGNAVFLTGVGRSGTTVLGNILGSLFRVEYDYEPLVLHTIPMFFARGEISLDVARELLRGYGNEILTSNLMGRNVNVRPTDDSRIWNRLSPDELMWRWYSLRDRKDVKKLSLQRQSLLFVKAINLMPFYALLDKAFPGCRVIHIVRHPFDVAKSVAKKGWVSEQNLNTLEGLPIKKESFKAGSDRGKMVPWWVKDQDVDDFFKASEFERALYYWFTLMLDGEAEARRMHFPGSDRYMEIRYEELVEDTRATVNAIAGFMGTSAGPMTESLLKAVRPASQNISREVSSTDQIVPRWRELLFQAMEKYGYLATV